MVGLKFCSPFSARQANRFAMVLLCLLALATGSAWGSIATDVVVSKDAAVAGTTITSPAFTTSTSNELLLAFVATDYLGGTNTTVKSIAGAGLTWALDRQGALPQRLQREISSLLALHGPSGDSSSLEDS